MGVFIGVVVLLVCVGFVVLMMVSEWKEAPSAAAAVETPAPAKAAAAKKSAPKKKAPAKKKPAAKKKK